MRSPQEIERQVAGLQAEKESLPQYNYFGGNNWALFDLMIAILKGEETYQPMDEDDEDYDEELDQAGYEASEWLAGYIQDDLFSEVK